MNFGKETEKIFELAKAAVPYVYKDGNGDYVTENISSYCAFITRDMIRDMRALAVLLMSKYPDFGRKVQEVSDVMNNKDLTICRMLDDRRAERELSRYEFDDTERAVTKLKEMYSDNAFEEAPFDFYKPKLKEWCSRFIMLDIRAYYIKSKDYIESSLKLASMRAYDDDGNLVFGISEKDEECVQIMAKMEELFLHALIRLPVYADELSECMEKIELIEWLIEAVTSSKDELITYLAKCAEAARDFDDAND